jgi:hypothetical protein
MMSSSFETEAGPAVPHRLAASVLVVATLMLSAGATPLLASSALAAPEVGIEAVVEQEIRENELSAEIQAGIDELAEDTEAMAARYRAALQNTRQLEVYNRQYAALIRAQEEEMASLRDQIDHVAVISRQVLPHMEEMIDALENFVALDVPFLPEERAGRVAELRAMMARADVTFSEKYRRILEAYQIENEYGRTIEAYRGSIERDGESRTVDFLRIGRNALLYQTLDGEESGAWLQDEKRWESVDDFRVPVREGLRMARKQRAPDLIEVPLPAAEVLR